MSENKNQDAPPFVFEKFGETWDLMTNECPECGDLMEYLTDKFYLKKLITPPNIYRRYHECTGCLLIVRWYPYRDKPEWKILK